MFVAAAPLCVDGVRSFLAALVAGSHHCVRSSSMLLRSVLVVVAVVLYPL